MEKRVSIEQVFYRVFLEEMTQRGFLLSRKYGMFMKLINNELLQYLSIENRTAYAKGNRAFSIRGNIVSIYMDAMDKKTLWLEMARLQEYSLVLHGVEHMLPDTYEYNDASAEALMEAALEDTKKDLFPLFEKTTDLEKYIEFAKVFRIRQIRYLLRYWADSLILIQCNDHDDFLGVLETYLKRQYDCDQYVHLKRWGEPEFDSWEEYKKKNYERFYESIVTWTAGERDQIYNDPKLYQAALEELERRKAANIEVLRGLKLYKDA